MAFERCTFDSRTVFTGATFDGEVEMDRVMADGPRLPAAAVGPLAAAAAVVPPFSRRRSLAEASTSENLGYCRRQSLEAPL